MTMIVRPARWFGRIALLASAAWLQSSCAANRESALTVGSKAPDFALEDTTGKRVSLASFAGRVVVLEWVNPECPFVRRHYAAQTMVRLYQKFKDRDVVWLSINSSHHLARKDNEAWATKNQLPYPVLDDHTGDVGRLYGAHTTPHMFIVDKGGQLVYRGAIDDDPPGRKETGVVNYLERALTQLLEGRPIEIPDSKPYGCSVKYAE
jgi:peroxiredoxin